MKTYVSISMATLAASLLVPEVFGQHAQADLDRMPIFPGKNDRAIGFLILTPSWPRSANCTDAAHRVTRRRPPKV
jgi:hypothetical protein